MLTFCLSKKLRRTYVGLLVLPTDTLVHMAEKSQPRVKWTSHNGPTRASNQKRAAASRMFWYVVAQTQYDGTWRMKFCGQLVRRVVMWPTGSECFKWQLSDKTLNVLYKACTSGKPLTMRQVAACGRCVPDRLWRMDISLDRPERTGSGASNECFGWRDGMRGRKNNNICMD